MVADPVALAFDDLGRLYVAETARRSTVDIDIRAHPDWLVDDLANQSVDDLRRFFRSKMAPELSSRNARWLADSNRDGNHDWKDLMSVKERIRLLEDPNGTGKATRSRLFFEGFNEEINGVLAGVMPWGGTVLATVYPDLWRLQDADKDGIAESKASLFRGFGVHAAFDGHDLHGLTMGPDGKIYFSHGDNGFSVTTLEGKRLHHPNTGGVLRMNPDGSELEVFATGLRNVQEIAFDDFGNLFSVDNDGDLEDERERFVYITEGSDSGWRLHWQFRDPGWAKVTGQPVYNPWTADRMWVPHFQGQPAHITPPLMNYSVGPSGFQYNPGTALNQDYAGHFFLAQFPVRKVTAFRTSPKGASFEMIDEHIFLSGMMASAVNFSPDGALYVADWDGMWAPNGKGAIWKLDTPASAGSPIRRQVKELLAEGMRERDTGVLCQLLGHPDMRVRLRAQFELTRRKDARTLIALANSTASTRFTRLHALWGLRQLKSPLRVEQLPLGDPDAELRAQAAKVAGELRMRRATPELITRLADSNLRVRFHAALALGKIGDKSALDPLVTLLAENRNEDAFIRHAGVMGLLGMGDIEQLSQLHSHPSVSVRLAAVVALRRLRSSAVGPFLRDGDPLVRREAARAIHDDDSILELLPSLAALLDEVAPNENEGVTRRAIEANLRLGRAEHAERLLRCASDSGRSESVRVEALESLASWNQTPYIDRVEGMVRFQAPRASPLPERLIKENAFSLLRGSGKEMAEALTRVLLKNRIELSPERVIEWIRATELGLVARTQALSLLARQSPERLPGVLTQVLDAPEVELREAAWSVLAQTSPEEFFASAKTRSKTTSIQERRTILRLMAPSNSPIAIDFLVTAWRAFKTGQLPPELALDVVEAMRASPDLAFKSAVIQHESSLNPQDSLAKYRLTLSGGDALKGRDIFRTHVGAQCVRCHEAGGEGFQAGPPLAGIALRSSPESLLESLVNPSAQLATGFENTTLFLRNNETIEGAKIQETAQAVTIKQASGEIIAVSRSTIESVSKSTISAMPAMGEILNRFEIRDLIAYLLTLK